VVGARWGKPRLLDCPPGQTTSEQLDAGDLAATVAAALNLPKREKKKMRLYLTASGAEIGSEDVRTELAEAQAAASCVHLSAVIDGGSRGFVANPAEASRLCESLEQAAKAETSLEKAAAASTAAFDDEARKPVLFWRDGDSNSYLSNWHGSPFVIAGQHFTCVEQLINSTCKLLAFRHVAGLKCRTYRPNFFILLGLLVPT
jgi:hypothetical protein